MTISEPCDRRWYERARPPRAQLSAAVERCAEPRTAGHPSNHQIGEVSLVRDCAGSARVPGRQLDFLHRLIGRDDHDPRLCEELRERRTISCAPSADLELRRGRAVI